MFGKRRKLSLERFLLCGIGHQFSANPFPIGKVIATAVTHHGPSGGANDSRFGEPHWCKIKERRQADRAVLMFTECGIPAVIIGIAERQVGDVALQVFHNVREGIGRILAQNVDIGLMRANMAEIGNADRGHKACPARMGPVEVE